MSIPKRWACRRCSPIRSRSPSIPNLRREADPMTLKLYYHPLSSFCWKALIALYENDTPFEPVLVNLGDPDSRAAFLAVWPVGQFPVVKDETRDRLVPESSIIVEYLDDHYRGHTRFIPEDKDKAREVRMRDRFFDH